MESEQQFGDYELVRELGRGGMGVVSEVRHRDLPDRRLALKQLLASAIGAQSLARFRREAELLARVDHVGVVRIHALEDSPAGLLMVTELVEGETLQDVLRRGPLEPRRAAELVRDVARAVAAVHAEGVLHRDIKPHNVMVRPDGSPVLLDFGLARAEDTERLTQTGAVLGTPAFAAPEQLDGQSVDERADVYGLGAVLLALLAGRPPFLANGAMAVVAAVLTKEPRWASRDLPLTPRGLEAISKRAMARDPADRQGSAGEVADDLERWLGQGDAPPRRSWWFLAAGLALALSAGTALVAVIPQETPAARTPPLLEEGPPSEEESQPTEPPPKDGSQPDDPAAAQERLRKAAAMFTRYLTLRTQGPCRHVRFVDHGRTVARIGSVVDGEGVLHSALSLWRPPAEEPGYHLSPGHYLNDLAALPNGNLAVASKRVVAITPAGEEASNSWPWRDPDATVVVALPDGRLAVGSGTDVWTFNLVTGDKELVLQCPEPVHGLAASSNGLLAVAAGESLTSREPVRVIDLSTGKQTNTISLPPPVGGLAFDPQGRRLAVGNNLGLLLVRSLGSESEEVSRCWEPPSLDTGRGVIPRGMTIRSVVFSPDGERLYALRGTQQDGSELGGWVLATGKRVLSDNSKGPVEWGTSLDLSPDGGTLAVGYMWARLELWKVPRPGEGGGR